MWEWLRHPHQRPSPYLLKKASLTVPSPSSCLKSNSTVCTGQWNWRNQIHFSSDTFINRIVLSIDKLTSKPKSSRIHKKKQEKKKGIGRNETHAKKWSKRWGANTYHEITPFIVLKCNKERVHEIFPEAATGCAL